MSEHDERHDDPIEFALLKLQDWQRPGTLAWSRDGLEALMAMRRELAEARDSLFWAREELAEAQATIERYETVLRYFAGKNATSRWDFNSRDHFVRKAQAALPGGDK